MTTEIDAPLAPMLASPMTDRLTGAAFDKQFRDGWALERKLDGHRITMSVRKGEVQAWSRPGRGKPALPRKLPPPMLIAMRHLGHCDVDGELVSASGKSWDVVTKGAHLVYVIFDIRSTVGWSVMDEPYDKRRSILLDHLRQLPNDQQSVSTVVSIQPPTWDDVQAIWADGGEGAILKRTTSRYVPGLRSPEWLKVKPEHHAVLTIVGYEAGKSGPYSAIRLVDADGHETTVKTLGHALLRDFTRTPAAFLGRQVVITYQERTPAGCYRHGRFDHFQE